MAQSLTRLLLSLNWNGEIEVFVIQRAIDPGFESFSDYSGEVPLTHPILTSYNVGVPSPSYTSTKVVKFSIRIFLRYMFHPRKNEGGVVTRRARIYENLAAW